MLTQERLGSSDPPPPLSSKITPRDGPLALKVINVEGMMHILLRA